MDVIHFTHGATDPLHSFEAKGVGFVPLADGGGDTHVSCAHLSPDAVIDAPSLTHAATMLVVHGRIVSFRQACLTPVGVRWRSGAGLIAGVVARVSRATELAVGYSGGPAPLVSCARVAS